MVGRTPGTTSALPRYCVRYRLGGGETAKRFGGSFRTEREAKVRRDVIGGELAALRVPDVRILERPAVVRTLRVVAEQWRSSRVDVASGTATTYEVNLGRILPTLGDRAVADLGVEDVTGLVADLAAVPLARESIRKTLTTLAQVLDFAGVVSNPVRDRAVKLPRLDRSEIAPLPPRTCSRSSPRSRPVTGCRSSSSTRPGCGSASSSVSPGATSTSKKAVGASRRPWQRPAALDGSTCRSACSAPSPSSARAMTGPPIAASSRASPERDSAARRGVYRRRPRRLGNQRRTKRLTVGCPRRKPVARHRRAHHDPPPVPSEKRHPGRRRHDRRTHLHERQARLSHSPAQ
jgi:hypothetical protein